MSESRRPRPQRRIGLGYAAAGFLTAGGLSLWALATNRTTLNLVLSVVALGFACSSRERGAPPRSGPHDD